MQDQNFKNHARLVPLYHGVASFAILIPFIISVIYFFKTIQATSGRLYAAATVCLIFGVLLLFWFARTFALKAQDRAIRAEENLRYFAITGSLMDSKLTMRQIIALRFAANNEFVDLAHRAVAENLTAKQIKMAIQHWKADFDRV
jgi:Family of unknown function (DUF6526)